LLLTGANTVQAAAQQFLATTTAIFAITLGKDGTMLGFNNALIIIPSIDIQPVDTTGAGDAFVGAVLYQLSQAMENKLETNTQQCWQNIVINANKAGARTCEYLGAMEAFKHLTNTIFN
jgi:fructokinase